jgi:hypothetical protein
LRFEVNSSWILTIRQDFPVPLSVGSFISDFGESEMIS